jgi:hypothetical protein
MTSVNSNRRKRNTPSPSARSLTPREAAVVELVGRFRQMRARQIGEVHFSDTSGTPLKRTLARLTDADYLARLERPRGGYGGGSDQYIYQLGRVGWREVGRNPRSYWAPTFSQHTLHTLAIADCYVRLLQAERTDELKVLTFNPEREARRTVGSIELTPDAFMQLGFEDNGANEDYSYWLELDRGKEDDGDIIDKLKRYWLAFSGGKWPDGENFPVVLFVVPDDRRKQQIEACIAGGPDEAADLFEVSLFDEFPAAL